MTPEPDRTPLVVDVDGTLLRTDLLWEGLLALVTRRPAAIPGFLAALFRGKADAKSHLASSVSLVWSELPRRTAVEALLQQARSAGSPIVVASGSPERWVQEVGATVEADHTLGTRDGLNLTSTRKLAVLRERYGRFDYVGNARQDLPLWKEARRAYATGLGPLTRSRARRARPDLIVLDDGAGAVSTLLRQLRPHQWAKNLLLLLPALAGHLAWTPSRAAAMLGGLVAFSATASMLYAVNDLLDLEHDRRHAAKRDRPLASGSLAMPSAIGLILILAGVAVATSLALPPRFTAFLGLYAGLSLAYSFGLKRLVLVDVVTLAVLYTTRVLAGAMLVDIRLSRWFLAFSVFVFFSLALAKRVVELRTQRDASEEGFGRGYRPADMGALQGLGAGAVMAASLVYCLYITSEDVTRIYAEPDYLWGGLPLLIYWQARIWLLVARDGLHDDPVTFTLRDRTSYLVAAGLLFVVGAATYPALLDWLFR